MTITFNENSTRITSGFRFLGPKRFTIDLVADIGLNTRSSLTNTSIYHKEYSKWRLWFGITRHFSIYKYFDKSAKFERKRREEELRKLRKIEQRRKKATRDMEKMKEMLKRKKEKENK